MQSLLNSHLSSIDSIIVFLNIIGAVYAAYWNFKASHTGILTKIRFTVGLMATVYALAYGFLLFFFVSGAAWSSTLRLFALLAWYFVWSAPPKKSMKMQHDLGTQLEKEVLKRMGINDDEKDGNER